jgi:SAM-dependent methyltransferase
MPLYLIVILAVVLAFGLGIRRGAPYLPILKRDSDALLALGELKAGQTIIDLGSGDGRLLREAARRGIRGIGYEINPILVLVSRLVCWRYRRLVTIHLADFWHVTLPPADAVYTFLLPRYMADLDQYLARQITKRTPLISFAFEIPGRRPDRHNRNTFIYYYGR